jgi:hypothetical protein
VCFLCEAAETGAEFVDTFKDFTPATFTALNGRKYVCSYCVRDLASHLDIYAEARDRYEARIDDLEHLLGVAESRLLARNDIIAAVENGLAINMLKPELVEAEPVEKPSWSAELVEKPKKKDSA